MQTEAVNFAIAMCLLDCCKDIVFPLFQCGCGDGSELLAHLTVESEERCKLRHQVWMTPATYGFYAI